MSDDSANPIEVYWIQVKEEQDAHVLIAVHGVTECKDETKQELADLLAALIKGYLTQAGVLS